MNGKNSNKGTSSSSPWKTLSAVKKWGEEKGFKAGDHILLKKGGAWDEKLYAYGMGTEKEPVVYGAYGSGENPLIRKGIYHRDYMHRSTPLKKNEWVRFENLDIDGADNGVDARTINHIELKNIRITRCENGIILASETGPLEHWTMEDVFIYENKGHGVFCYTDINEMKVRRLSTYHNGKDGAAFRTGTNNTVEDSVAYGNGEDGFDAAGFTGTLSYIRCISRNNKSAGFSIKAKGSGKATGHILYSISHGNFQGLEVGNESNSTAYNSIFFNNSFIGIDLISSFQHSIKNCIIYKNGENPADRGFQVSYRNPGQRLELSSNCYGRHSKGRNIYLKQEKRFVSLEEWQGLSLDNPQDLNSFVADPEFTDLFSGNFTLKPSSPCIDSGVNINPALRFGIHPDSSWVNAVSILDQNLHGSGWEIGPFVFKQ
ncbi:MAG: right-handed parallel beta-helix repeat-containing protein [Desulfobacteraceae bacterium]|nr:right-handed parallel beta-helix repeat-containing protein [Desulfobacteraceae bacterium]